MFALRPGAGRGWRVEAHTVGHAECFVLLTLNLLSGSRAMMKSSAEASIGIVVGLLWGSNWCTYFDLGSSTNLSASTVIAQGVVQRGGIATAGSAVGAGTGAGTHVDLVERDVALGVDGVVEVLRGRLLGRLRGVRVGPGRLVLGLVGRARVRRHLAGRRHAAHRAHARAAAVLRTHALRQCRPDRSQVTPQMATSLFVSVQSNNICNILFSQYCQSYFNIFFSKLPLVYIILVTKDFRETQNKHL